MINPTMTTHATASVRRRRTTALPAVALVGAVALAGCGDDAGASEEYADFCDAELAMEQASMGDDEAAVGAAAEQLIEASPNDDTREKVQATLDAFAALEGPPDADFNENYSFSGLDDEYDAGATVITLENEADEFHEFILMRRVDGDDTPIMELLSMDFEEVGSYVTEVGGAFAGPGQTSYTAVELEPGEYVAVCFLPQGSTQEAWDTMMSGGPEPDGDPHAMHGMTAEFEVTA